jgi:predicted glycosyltransferase
MRVLIDIGHPAHAHFFHHPIRLLQADGHEVLITSRDKEIALELLDELDIHHEPLSCLSKKGGIVALGKELIQRDIALYKVVRRYRPDIMAAIGGVFIAQVGWLTGIPSLVFYDTENATLQNAITYPFASCVLVPRCYEAWLPRQRHIRYAGYHELSYLHPNYFTANRETAVANGLAEKGDTFLIRLVSWQANHDIGENGWSVDMTRKAVAKLNQYGKVLISAEGSMPHDLEQHRYRGKVSAIHHVMAYCRGFIGESATMASECAVLGVPAIYAAETGRGYTNEQEERFGLVFNVSELKWEILEKAIDALLQPPPSHWVQARAKLLGEMIDVSRFIHRCITTFPGPLQDYQRQRRQ